MPRSWYSVAAANLIFLLLLALQPVSARVVINEIHYNPDQKTEPAEFVELYNSGVSTVDLSGWRLSGGVEYILPNGTLLAPEQCLVVAQNPSTVLAKFSVNAYGPWSGQLNNSGDEVLLLNASGGVEDRVEYQLGFPWPTVGGPPGYSIELIHPSLDTDLGGSWRASVSGSALQTTNVVINDHTSGWKYFKGLSEASSPSTAWRFLNFDDTAWASGAAPVGYDSTYPMGTAFPDMSGQYSSFFLRKTFVVTNPASISSLRLEALYDDGFKLWINGTNVLNQALPAGEVAYNATATGSARESNAYDTFNLDNPGRYLRAGTNILTVQVHNILLSGSSDCFFDCRLSALTGPSTHGPTPGRMNSVFATNAPPQIRQVDHSPQQPASGQAVVVSGRVTDPDGVANVTLLYQVVEPGAYLPLTDAAYATNWTTAAMNDQGINGDEQGGDSVFSVTIPSAIQQHRRLVRYRIRAIDSRGYEITVPYADDPQPNFAYFCYDGVPAWQAALRPGATPVVAFDTNVMRRLPSVHLIAARTDVENATWFSRYGGDAYPWLGTLVYDGKVYDHVHFRARGGVWRYAMVKNMWKFDLNRGHDLEMRDDYGRKFDIKWTKLNLGACIQQGDYGHRGEQGMFESVGFRLFNLAGVEAPNTTFLQFRVIDEASEAPADQYQGDFWGLYLGVEQEDGRFLDEHNLPDGNLYKIEGGTGTLNNLGPAGPTDRSDLDYFLNNYRNSSVSSSEPWWRTNLNLANYWSYQSIVQGIHHYDICDGKNYFYYRNPITGLWSVHSWDLDLTWADNMYNSGCGGVDNLYSPVFGGGSHVAKPAMTLEYRNRVREIRDLLFNTDQAFQVIDEYAGLLTGTNGGPTFLDADRYQWDYNPKMANSAYSSALSKAGQGLYYSWPYEPSVPKTFAGGVQLMKNYVTVRSSLLDNIALDTLIPAQPLLSYVGPGGYPLNKLVFRSSPFSGSAGFAAIKWRVAEVTNPAAPVYDPAGRRLYEITPAWESGEIVSWSSDMTLPSAPLKAGHAYRARVRHKDVTGRWSRWSAPVQFVAGMPDTAAALTNYLRITELMYAPTAGNDYEFVELQNTSSSVPLDLSGAKFTSGIDFTFPGGTTLAPGAYLLVARATNQAAFRAWYKLDPGVSVVGPYSGTLNNQGEALTLKVSSGGDEIASFEYNKGRGWPIGAMGAGHSIVPLDRAIASQADGALDYPGNWRCSTAIGGSPGDADPLPPSASVVINEVTAHTDYFDQTRPEYDSNDWIELFNATGSDIALTNGFLSDDPSNPRKWPIPAVVIPARGRVVFDEIHNFHNPITTGFGIDKAGEQLLLSTDERVLDAVEFKGQENGVSLGRYPDGAAWWYTMPRSSNVVNSAGLVGVVISEIMYHPADASALDNTWDEFIEIYNPTGSACTLQDTNGAWRLGGGVEFTFPADTVLPAGATLLVVNFDPVNSQAMAAFRQVYGLTNGSVSILGPYTGKLGNRSDRVAIEKPQFPDLIGDPYSWVIVDEVIYGNQNPWPAAANGLGRSLERLSPSKSGNDPENWAASVPNPGLMNSAPLDSDGDGMPDSWELRYQLDPRNPGDGVGDADMDGMSNLAEFMSGTDPRDAASALRIEWVDNDPITPGIVRFRFHAMENRTYTVQIRPEAPGALWEKLLDVPAGPGREIEVTDSSAGEFRARFYRLVTPSVP